MINRSQFPLTHENKLTCQAGQLAPFYVEETLPGDIFSVNTSIIVRLMPQIAPFMHNVNVYVHFFFVPYRLVWNNWVNFITGGEHGNDASVFPTISTTNPAVGSLLDYLGIPPNVDYSGATPSVSAYGHSVSFSALPIRAYDLIWNEYYRDENLQDKLTISLDDGVDTTSNHEMLYRCWQKDFFTSAANATQKGSPVVVPLGSTAPVITSGQDIKIKSAASSDRNIVMNTDNVLKYDSTALGSAANARFGSQTGLLADLSSATGISLNTFRQCARIQAFLETNMRSGSRYNEFLYGHWRIISSDKTLQRPQYLGGGKAPIVVSEVLQTSSTGTTPQGNMAGHAFSAFKSAQFKKYFEEYGVIIGILSIMPRTGYMQGMRKMWNKRSKYEFGLPELAHLGEQAVLKKELMLTSSGLTDDNVFGYNPQYQEYRVHYDEVHGQFRTTLWYWHLTRAFATQPSLSSDFVTTEGNMPTRIFATTSGDNYLVRVGLEIDALRALPKYATPGIHLV